MALVSAPYGFDVLNGQVFVGTTAAAGVTIPIYTNTSQTFGLWNPTGSGKNAVLIRCDLGYVSATAAASNYVYSYQTGCGSAVGTTAPITAFTKVAPLNCLIGGGNASSMFFAPATITLTTANTLFKTMGLNNLVTTAATTGATGWVTSDFINGAIVVTPGTLFCVSGNIAPVTVCDISLTWEEV